MSESMEKDRFSNDAPVGAGNSNLAVPTATQQPQQSQQWLPPSAGFLQPAPYQAYERKFANAAPMGLCGFALTTFVLSLINVQTRGVTVPNLVVGSAYAYGGLVQLISGVLEAVTSQNTFGATALASFGGFWISFAIIETVPSVTGAYPTTDNSLNYSLGFFFAGWFIFTFMLLVCTIRATVVFFALFFTLDMAFLMLSIARFYPNSSGDPNPQLVTAGGVFGLLAAFLAWYAAFAGMATKENSFVTIPLVHMPWSEVRRKERAGPAVDTETGTRRTHRE